MAINIFPQQKAFADILGSDFGTALQALAEGNIQEMLQRRQGPSGMQGLQGLSQNNQPMGMAALQQQPQQQANPIEQLMGAMQQQAPQEGPQQEDSFPGLSKYQSNRIKDLESQGSRLKAADKKELKDLYGIQQKQSEINEKRYSAYRDWYKPYMERAKEAGDTRGLYSKLAKLAESGDLYSGSARRVLDKLPGGDLVSNSATDIANKLISNLKVHSARLFPPGTKVTNFMESLSAGTIPGLKMNNDSIAALSDLNDTVQEAMEIEEEAARKLGKKWKGVLPWSSDSDFYEEVGPKLKKLQEKGNSIVDTVLSGKSYAKQRSFMPGKVLGSNVNEYANSLPDGTRVKDIETGKTLRWNASKKKMEPV